MSAPCPSEKKLWGLSIKVTEETERVGDLAVGAYVKVRATFRLGELTATHIAVITREASPVAPEELGEAVELVSL